MTRRDYVPHDYQNAMVEHIFATPRCALWAGMGMGKTSSVLTAIQPWDFVAANNIGFFEGNAIKYLTRWRDKGGIEDLKKAQHYIEKLIELEQAKP